MAWIVLFAVKVEHVSNVGRGRGVDLARLHWFLPIDCEGRIIPDGRDRLRRLEGRLTWHASYILSSSLLDRPFSQVNLEVRSFLRGFPDSSFG